VLFLVVLLLLAACQARSPELPSTTTAPPPLAGAESPDAAVSAWLNLLGKRDYQATPELVPDEQVALLAAVEGWEPAQVLAALEEGVPPEVRENFWRAFTESFPAFSGEEVGDLVVGTTEEFEIAEEHFAAVQVVFSERLGSGDVVAVQDRAGRWWVDLFATFGHAFARPLQTWLEDVPYTGDGARLRNRMGAYKNSFLASLERYPLGQPSESAVSDLQYLIAQLG
jgi:hypothetical protein